MLASARGQHGITLTRMGDMESAIAVKGQATIPKEIRKHVGLKPGVRLKFFLHPDGTVVLLPKLPARSAWYSPVASPTSSYNCANEQSDGRRGIKQHHTRKMPMIGLDTNILIRYLTQDDPVQSAKATESSKAD